MKIRNGFVSNSSSSSFIIDGGNVFKVAKDMLSIIQSEWLDWDENKTAKARTRKQFKVYFNNIGKLKKLPQNCDGIMMPSCNYDTYIMHDYDRDCLLIATCNNHHWDDLHYTSVTESEDSLINTVIHRSNFYDVRTGFVLKYPIYVDGYFTCPKCLNDKVFEYYPMLDDVHVVCGSCFKVIDMPIIRRGA